MYMLIRSTDLLASTSFFKEAFQTPIYSDENSKHNFLIKITRALELTYDNADLKIAALANNIAISQRQIYRICNDTLNVTPATFLRLYRLEKSLWFIKQGESVGNIAFNVGFSSHSYFSRCFKQSFGYTPSEFVESLKDIERQNLNNDWQDTVN